MKRPILSVIALFVVLSTLIRCQTTGVLPDTPLGHRLAELITVLNSGSYSSIREYAGSNFSEEMIAGSVGKLYTTIAIAQLAEQELLTYGDPIKLYLGPDWISPDVAAGITIEHLLTHRSGLGDYKPVIRNERP